MGYQFPPVLPEDYWANSHFSIARYYGQVQLNGSLYIIVDRNGQDIFKLSAIAKKAGREKAIEPGEPCDLCRKDWIPSYKALGRDLYMVMDILHFAMERGCIIHTVKDRFTLGDDIQSKVLAFAFGLSAEIERQMIRQRTKEGLKLRVKMGILLGRPPMVFNQKPQEQTDLSNQKDKVIEQYQWGVPMRRLAANFNVERNTIERWLHRWGVKTSKWIEKQDKLQQEKPTSYKDGDYEVIKDIDRARLVKLIECDMTIPQIAEQYPEYTYEQVYDTIYCDKEFNSLYRKHGQLKIKKRK